MTAQASKNKMSKKEREHAFEKTLINFKMPYFESIIDAKQTKLDFFNGHNNKSHLYYLRSSQPHQTRYNTVFKGLQVPEDNKAEII